MKKINFSIFTKAAVISLFFCLISSIAYAQDPALIGKERSARIDIYSQDKQFDLTSINSNGKFWSPGKTGQQSPWWITELGLNGKDKWQKLWIEFTPSDSGSVFIELRGSNFTDLKKNRHEVYFDEVVVEGKDAEINNGGFEKLDSKGNPAGWGYASSSKSGNINKNEAHSGKYSVLVWHDSPVIQKVAVKAGNKYKISAWVKPAR
ncbi:MAG: hypothetical protein PHF11_03145 [Candidatus Omnitrophica bacterium]|nr:hypothetical protein [Candidatus Omnitrophota bacterium]